MGKLFSAMRRTIYGTPYEIYWKHREKALSSGKIGSIYHKIKCARILRSYNAFIPLSAQFAGKPSFPHELNGIFLSQGAVIGKNCTIFHQVTIGSVASEGSKHIGSPVIGDNVIIGAGAKIIGNVHVGNNVRIGANCVVTEDIPDNSTVVLPHPRIIAHEESRNNDFVPYKAD